MTDRVKYRTRLAQLIAQEEGFNIPGSIPWRRHNPGDLRHSPHGSHEGIGANDIAIEPDDQTGEDDLERQLQLYATRGMTLEQAINAYAPVADDNNTSAYLAFVCKGLGGLSPKTLVSEALLITPI